MKKKKTRNNPTELVNFTLLLLPFLALVAPFLVWPVEILFPYPHIVEELAKGVLAFVVVRSSDHLGKNIRYAILLGVLFTFSEIVLYSFNLYYTNTVSSFLLRLIFTTTLHVTTLICMVISTIPSRKFLPVGFLAAVLIHYLYNLWI